MHKNEFCIDTPVLHHPVALIQGWHGLTEESASTYIWIEGGGRQICSRCVRPDVAQAFPTLFCTGFSAVIDFSKLDALNNCSELTIRIVCEFNSDRKPFGFTPTQLKIDPNVWEAAQRSRTAKNKNSDWLKSVLICPNCRSASRFRESKNSLICQSCNTQYERALHSINMISPEMAIDFRIESTDSISDNSYDEVSLSLIEDAAKKNGIVLDCGSGLRRKNLPNVINLEIVDYPTTDVLGVSQRLPFASNTFDVILSLNVLEHVTDPFACADEMVRVLKPGGKLYCAVPFLQPEHGYPHHYFNMTRSGLAELFKSKLVTVNRAIRLSGRPIWTLHWFLTEYLSALPTESRDRFRSLTVKEIVDKHPSEWLKEDIAENLSEEANWKLASVTTAIFRKPQ